ncbi:unnamed protein product [Ectocarpus sp. 12 AP-2014]
MVEFSPLPVLFVASVLYTISAFDAEGGDGNGTKAWAIFCGLISSFVSGILAFLQARGKGDMIHKFQKFIALFFFLWWTLGAGIGTFKGPFTISGNGYFAGWIAFAASLKYAYGTNDAVRGFADRAADAMKEHQPTDPDGGFDPQDQAEAYA